MRRQEVGLTKLASIEFDLLISAYDATDRVEQVFEAVHARSKHWLLHDEYEYSENQKPRGGDIFEPGSTDEADFWLTYFASSGVSLADFGPTRRLCIDATGFMRPHLMVLLALARLAPIDVLDIIYADPIGYSRAEKTTFSGSVVTEVRQVRGFEGVHEPALGELDLLLIGAGYDDRLMARVAESKRAARKMQIFGLPSLRPHMYQESRLRARRAEESIGPNSSRDILFAPAANPFVTADVLSAAVDMRRKSTVSPANIYLSALGTKPQVLGFALYYLLELAGTAASAIFPYSESYKTETTYGISRVWHYQFELT